MKSNDLLNIIRANPGATTKQIADLSGVGRNTVSAHTKYLLDQGHVTREVAGKTLTGVAFYGYKAVSGVVPARKPGPKAKAESVKTTGDKGSLDSVLEQMAKMLADQIISRARAHLQVELSSLVPELSAPAPQMPSVAEIMSRAPALPAPKQAKPKVVVMCLLPKQSGQLQTEFHDVFDLLFWNDRFGDSKDRLKMISKTADVVFNHVEHCSHQYEEIVQNTGARLVRVNGGLSQMRDALTKYYVEEVSA